MTVQRCSAATNCHSLLDITTWWAQYTSCSPSRWVNSCPSCPLCSHATVHSYRYRGMHSQRPTDRETDRDRPVQVQDTRKQCRRLRHHLLHLLKTTALSLTNCQCFCIIITITIIIIIITIITISSSIADDMNITMNIMGLVMLQLNPCYNKCIGDDTKAAAHRSPNCIGKIKNTAWNDFQHGG